MKKYLLEKSKDNNPDLWASIEKRLDDKKRGVKFIKDEKKNKKIYTQVILAAAIIIVMVGVQLKPGIKLFDYDNNTEIVEKSKEPVQYSSLDFGDSNRELKLQDNNNSQYYGYSNDQSQCIKEFSEDFLKDLNLMCKVTVLNVYLKNYNCGENIDKSRVDNELTPCILQSRIYEVKINKIYYSESYIKEGDIIKIEQYDFNEEFNSELLENHQYILPLVNIENSTIRSYIQKEGQYCIVYPYINQIEVTKKGEYVFHDGWKSLIDENTVDVILDNESDKNKKVLFEKQLKLRRDKEFENDIVRMIDKYKNK